MTSTKSFSTALRVAGYTTLLVSLVFLGTGCKRKIAAPAATPATPEDIKDLIAKVSGPKKKVGGIIANTPAIAAAQSPGRISAPGQGSHSRASRSWPRTRIRKSRRWPKTP